MNTRTPDYWEKRSLERLTRIEQFSRDYYDEICKLHARAFFQIKKDIERIYNRFVLSGMTSPEEAEHLLTVKQTAEHRAMLRERLNAALTEKERNRILAELNAPAYAARITRLEAIYESLDATLYSIVPKEISTMDEALQAIARMSYMTTMYDIQHGTGLSFAFAAITDDFIHATLDEKWEGKHFSDRVWTNTSAVANRAKAAIALNVSTGRSWRRCMDDLKTLINTDRAGANFATERLLRTETNRVHNQIDAYVHERVGFERYRFIATLDERTSETCQKHDGNIDPDTGKEYTYENRKDGINYPPLHPFCRSTTCGRFDAKVEAKMMRTARDPLTGKQYSVPYNMTYNEWIRTLTPEQRGGIKHSMPGDIIVRGLPDISKIKSNSDIQAFAEKLIDDLGIDRSDVTVKMDVIRERGYCAVADQTTLDKLHYSEYVLSSNDKRPIQYRVKTAFHEAFHLLAQGREWDGMTPDIQLKEPWRNIEETFTEASAHYLLERYGVQAKLAPSYPKELVENLPRIKRMPKYAKCNTIQDFGKRAFTERLNGGGAKWVDFYQKMEAVTLPDGYYNQYHDYIEKHEEDILDMLMDDIPDSEDYRAIMECDLKNAMSKDRMSLTDNELHVYNCALACAMQKEGIK